MNRERELLKFGNYVTIEMKRYGVENEHYIHKVIRQLESNVWVDVPVQEAAKESMHKEVVPVVSCICCGVDETKVLRFRVSDVKPTRLLTDTSPQQQKPLAEHKILELSKKLGRLEFARAIERAHGIE